MTMYHRILITLAIVVILAVVFNLVGCARHQPMGEDIWIGVMEVERGRG